jgi:hypothetical protein
MPLVVQAVQQLQGLEQLLSHLSISMGEPAAADAADLLTAVQTFTSKWGG